LRLRSFVQSARLGSFAAAADALGYTAPAVSLHVAQLERELECGLLVRGARGVHPTAPGAILIERAERLLADAHLTAIAVREAAGLVRSLRLGSFPSAAQLLVPEALATMRNAHPDLDITLHHYEPPDGLSQLTAGDVDAVVTHRYPGVTWAPPTGVRVTTLGRDPLLLMVPVNHWLAGRSRVDIETLAGETFVSGNPTDANRIALALACSAAGFVPKVSFETDDYIATANLVERGFGIAVIPRMAMPAQPRTTHRLLLRVGDKPISRDIALAHRTGRLAPLIEELRNHLASALKKTGRPSEQRGVP
jgi:DNA-binding transcriptional LysR family regulator